MPAMPITVYDANANDFGMPNKHHKIWVKLKMKKKKIVRYYVLWSIFRQTNLD